MLFDLFLTCFIYCYLIHFSSLQLKCQVLESRNWFFCMSQSVGICFLFLGKYLIMLTSILLWNRVQFLNKRKKKKKLYTKSRGRTVHACLFDLYLFGGLPSQSSWLTSYTLRHLRTPVALECWYHWNIDWWSVLGWAQDYILHGQRAWTKSLWYHEMQSACVMLRDIGKQKECFWRMWQLLGHYLNGMMVGTLSLYLSRDCSPIVVTVELYDYLLLSLCHLTC